MPCNLIYCLVIQVSMVETHCAHENKRRGKFFIIKLINERKLSLQCGNLSKETSILLMAKFKVLRFGY